jgi:hypothetical protein
MLEAAGADRPKNVPLDGQSFLPQLRGQRGNPREWIYCWHDPRPGWDKEPYRLEIFARDQRYKLYSDGRFYNVSNDVLEQKPIPLGRGGSAATAARVKLKAVLDKMKREGARQPS